MPGGGGKCRNKKQKTKQKNPQNPKWKLKTPKIYKPKRIAGSHSVLTTGTFVRLMWCPGAQLSNEQV